MSETEKRLHEQVRNASIGRYRHFESAERHGYWNSWIGVPVVIINIVLSSVLLWAVTQDMPDLMKWVAAVLALIAAILSGIQTFFSFSRMFEGHRRLGNRYLEIMRETDRIIGLRKDGVMEDDEFYTRADTLFKSYQQINRDSESFPTSKKVFQYAMSKEEERLKTLQERRPEAMEFMPNKTYMGSLRNRKTNVLVTVGTVCTRIFGL